MGKDKEENDGGLVAFACLAGALVAALLLWQRLEEPLIQAILDLARSLMTPLGLVSDKYARAAETLANVAPGDKDMTFALALLSRVLLPYVLCLCLPVLALIVALGWRANVRDAHRQTLGLRDLLERVHETSPCIQPILHWPCSLLDEPIDAGPWMAARQPLQLAAENGLLLRLDGIRPRIVARDELLTPDGLARGDSPWFAKPRNGLCLDREAAYAFYAGSMGPRWEGFERLSPTLHKLACAFALYACDEKKDAQRLLDELSASFRVVEEGAPARSGLFRAWGKKKGKGEKATEVRTGQRKLRYTLDTNVDASLLPKIDKALESELVRKLFHRHGTWTNMILLALYEAARRKGVLPTAEFIWLKPVNRVLFYLMNNMGRRTAWPEIAGPWAHYEAEKRYWLFDPKAKGIVTPQVEEGVNALEVALYDEGWISPDMVSRYVVHDRRTLGMD